LCHFLIIEHFKKQLKKDGTEFKNIEVGEIRVAGIIIDKIIKTIELSQNNCVKISILY
jgi:hypothetical protein